MEADIAMTALLYLMAPLDGTTTGFLNLWITNPQREVVLSAVTVGSQIWEGFAG